MVDEALFEGTGGAKECSEFIRSVRAHAFSQGKMRDDEWMADYASTRVTDDAGIWFEGLEEETQTSWKLLRKALMDQYATASTASAPSATIPTPAAAAPAPDLTPKLSIGSSASLVPTPVASGPNHVSSPSSGSFSSFASVIATGSEPPTPNPTLSPSNMVIFPQSHKATTVGLLRKLGGNGQADLYISRKFGLNPAKKALLQTTTSRKDALRVSYITSAAGSSGAFQKKHIAVEGTDYRLGVIWNNQTPDFKRGCESYAALTAAEEGTKSIDQKDTLFPSAKWEGRLHSGVWRIAADGEVTAALRADDGSTLVLETAFIPLTFNSRDYEVYFYADYEGFRKTQRVLTDRRGQLVFEPI